MHQRGGLANGLAKNSSAKETVITKGGLASKFQQEMAKSTESNDTPVNTVKQSAEFINVNKKELEEDESVNNTFDNFKIYEDSNGNLLIEKSTKFNFIATISNIMIYILLTLVILLSLFVVTIIVSPSMALDIIGFIYNFIISM